MQSPYPIWQQLLILGIMPPIVALMFGALCAWVGQNSSRRTS
jgi:hypothetical protein